MPDKFTVKADKKAKAKAAAQEKAKKKKAGGFVAGAVGAAKAAAAKATAATGSSSAGASQAGLAPDYVNNVSIQSSLHEQCYLIEKAQEIYTAKKSEARNQIKPLGQRYVVRQLGLKPLTSAAITRTNLQYVNYITRLNKTKNFFQITPEEKARIAHYAVISVGYRRPGAKDKIKSVFTNDHRRDLPNKLDIFRSQGQRIGAGIQSIDVTYEGIDSATRKVVGVKVKYIFQDLRTMLANPYIELFTIGMTKTFDNKKYHRTIDFELGWRSTPDITSRLNLDHLKLILRTYIEKYTFDIQQDGSIVVTANYRGHFARVFHGPNSNILSSAKSYFNTVSNAINEIEAKAIEKQTATMEEQQKSLISKVSLLMLKRQLEQNALSTTESYESLLVKSVQRGNKGKGNDASDLLKAIEANVNQQAGALQNVGGADWASEEGKLLKGYITAHMKQLRDQIAVDLAARGSGGFGGTDDATARANAAKTSITMMKSAQNMERRQETADNSAAAALNAENLARQQQLKEAKMAKYLALREIAKKLVTEQAIHYAYLSRTAVEEFVTASAIRNSAQIKVAMQTLAPSVTLAPVTIDETAIDEQTYQVVPFVFLGKLVENILKLPASDPNSNDPKGMIYDLMLRGSGAPFTIDFGYFSYRSPYTGTPIDDFPLYYLPISLKKINDFFAREIIAKEKDFFAFDDFLMAILKKFLTGIFTLCASEANVEGVIPPKIQTVSGDRNRKMQYFVFGAKNALNDLKRGQIKFGSYNSNWKHHIYHFYLGGQIKGAVTSVKLIDIADVSTRTAVYSRNMASARDDLANYPVSPQAGVLPPVVFSAEITSLGFPLYNIAQFVYVDLLPYIGGNTKDASRHYKANGYYRIHKVNHSFTAENFSSTISTIIELSKYDWFNKDKKSKTAASSGKPAVPLAATPSSSETAKKLKVLREEQALNVKRAEWAMKYAAAGGIADLGPLPGAPTVEERVAESKLLKAREAYLTFKETDAANNAVGGDKDCAFKNKYPKYYKLLASEAELDVHFDGSNKPVSSPC